MKVTNLHKPFWPKLKLTKGDLMRYYARVAPFILPAVADRPLVMKRFPNGVGGAPFYQHRAPDVPPGVRTEVVGVVEERPQIIGGSLKALLYMTQLAAISQDPWFSRVAHPGVRRLRRVRSRSAGRRAVLAACSTSRAGFATSSTPWARSAWRRRRAPTACTSTCRCRPGTPYEAGMIYCQIVAALVEQKHPRAATTERSVKARGKRIYIDCLQNILGKTLATAYSARASDYAGVSTPVTWQEIDDGFDRTEFTITTAPARFERSGICGRS